MASSPTPSADSRTRAEALREALATRVVVADGAMGTMLQAQDPTLEDFQNLEGCNEILNVTRPDIVRSVHEEYFAVGVDCVETNTFGANLAALGEYDIPERVFELSESGARIAREVADEFTASTGQQRWVLGSMGPGTKLPTLGHAPYVDAARRLPAERRGHDRRRRRRAPGGDHPGPAADQGRGPRRPPRPGGHRRQPPAHLLGDRRDDRHDAAGLGDRRGADRAGAAGHRHDRPELRDRPGRDERAPALPRPALPDPAVLHAERRPAGARQGRRALPADRRASWPTPRRPSSASTASRWSAAAAVRRRSICARSSSGSAAWRRPSASRAPSRAPPRSTRPCRSARTPRTWRSASGRTPTGRRSSARPCWRAAGTTAWRWPATRSARARTCSTCASTTSAATASPTWRSWPAASPPPRPCRSCWTPPKSTSCGPGWRSSAAARSSTPSTTRTATVPSRASRKVTELAVEHGAALIALTIDEEGQARTAEHKVAIAERLIDDLTGNWGVHESDILIDTLTFTICTGQEESRKDGIATIEAIRELKRRHPDVQTTLGLSNISFGLNPAARIVLNSVFLDECVKAGLDSAIVHASQDPADRPAGGGAGQGRARPDLRPAQRGLRPAAEAHGALRGRQHEVDEGGQGRGTPRPAAGRAPASAASSTARRTAWRPTSTRRSRPVPPSTSSTTPCWTA